MSEILMKKKAGTKENVYPYITSHPNILHGIPIIEGTRTPVRSIVGFHYHLNMSINEILESLPHLTLAQIHAALAYYHDHKAEIDADIQDNNDIGKWKKYNEEMMEK